MNFTILSDHKIGVSITTKTMSVKKNQDFFSKYWRNINNRLMPRKYFAINNFKSSGHKFKIMILIFVALFIFLLEFTIFSQFDQRINRSGKTLINGNS